MESRNPSKWVEKTGMWAWKKYMNIAKKTWYSKNVTLWYQERKAEGARVFVQLSSTPKKSLRKAFGDRMLNRWTQAIAHCWLCVKTKRCWGQENYLSKKCQKNSHSPKEKGGIWTPRGNRLGLFGTTKRWQKFGGFLLFKIKLTF